MKLLIDMNLSHPGARPDRGDQILHGESWAVAFRLGAVHWESPRVTEVLNRKRPLSLNMIRRLYVGLGIPAEVLVQPYAVAEDRATYGIS